VQHAAAAGGPPEAAEGEASILLTGAPGDIVGASWMCRLQVAPAAAVHKGASQGHAALSGSFLCAQCVQPTS
jgi:hypothetical protein